MAGLSPVAVLAVCLVLGVCEDVTGGGCASSGGGLVMCMLTVIHHNMDVGMSDVGGLFLCQRWLCYHRWLCQQQG